MIIHLSDYYIDFVKSKMQEIDCKLFTDEDFELFQSAKHDLLGYFHGGEIVTICGLLYVANTPFVTYTWCDGTLTGKKAFIKGIDYIIEKYPDVQFVDEVKDHVLYKTYMRRK